MSTRERPLGVADPLIRLPGVDRQDVDVGVSGQHPSVIGDAVGKVVPLHAQSIAQAIPHGADLSPADQVDEVCHQTSSSSSLLKLTRAMDQHADRLPMRLDAAQLRPPLEDRPLAGVIPAGTILQRSHAMTAQFSL
jgi:hypothetical protein